MAMYGDLNYNPFAPKPDPKGPVVDTSTITPQAASTNPPAITNPFATLGFTPQTPDYNLNPMPTNTTGSAPTSVQNFLDTFRYQNPTQGTPQWMFNDIATKYGTNAAWSWALNNAWNDLGGYGETGLRGLMDKAGIQGVDQNRIINTYGSSKSNYWDGYRNDMTALGNPFDPNSAYSSYRNTMNTLHPSNITYNGVPALNTTNPNTNTVINTTPQVTNTNQSPQTGTNFYGYNPYANTNLAGNPYSTQGIKPVPGITTTTTNQASGDTSIQQTPVTGVS